MDPARRIAEAEAQARRLGTEHGQHRRRPYGEWPWTGGLCNDAGQAADVKGGAEAGHYIRAWEEAAGVPYWPPVS